MTFAGFYDADRPTATTAATGKRCVYVYIVSVVRRCSSACAAVPLVSLSRSSESLRTATYISWSLRTVASGISFCFNAPLTPPPFISVVTPSGLLGQPTRIRPAPRDQPAVVPGRTARKLLLSLCRVAAPAAPAGGLQAAAGLDGLDGPRATKWTLPAPPRSKPPSESGGDAAAAWRTGAPSESLNESGGDGAAAPDGGRRWVPIGSKCHGAERRLVTAKSRRSHGGRSETDVLPSVPAWASSVLPPPPLFLRWQGLRRRGGRRARTARSGHGSRAGHASDWATEGSGGARAASTNRTWRGRRRQTPESWASVCPTPASQQEIARNPGMPPRPWPEWSTERRRLHAVNSELSTVLTGPDTANTKVRLSPVCLSVGQE